MQDLKSTLQQEIATEKIVVYSKSYCPYCIDAKALLNQGGVQFKAYELDQMDNGDAIQNSLQQISGQKTVPNIFIGGKHVGGCSDLKAAHSAGKLNGMLTAAGIQHSF